MERGTFGFKKILHTNTAISTAHNFIAGRVEKTAFNITYVPMLTEYDRQFTGSIADVQIINIYEMSRFL